MARIDSLNNFLTDVADSIREMSSITELIPASEFDINIRNIKVSSDTEITDGYYLFYENHRYNVAKELVDMCNNMTDTYYMFYKATSIDIPIDLTGKLDTLTNTKSYSYMFYNASSIPSIKMSSTSNKPTVMDRMFSGCSSLESVDLTGLNVSEITTLQYLFQNCTSLKRFDLGNKEFPLVTNVSYMFYGCSGLEEIELSEITIPNNITIQYMFYNCSSAETIKLMKLNGISGMNYTFYGCDHLKEIDFNNNVLDNVTNVSYMFASNSTDTTIEGVLDLELSNVSFSKVTTKTYFLTGNKCLRTIDLSPFDTLIFTKAELINWFKGASSLIEINLTPIHTDSTISSLNQLFTDCVRLKKIIGLENINTTNLTSTTGVYRMFSGCKSLEEVNLSTLNTANITNNSNNISTTGLVSMFENCESLPIIDIAHFIINTAIYSISAMFYNCKSAITINIPDFTTATGLTNASYTFYNCESLTSIDGSKIPWLQLTNMSYMFQNAGIIGIDNMPVLESVPVAKSYTAISMFRGCKNLKKIDARFLGRNTNTNNNSMNYLFAECENLEEVDLSNYYNMNNTSAGAYMFKGCKSLKTVKFHHVAGEYICNREGYWSGCAGMFDGCESLEVLDLRYFCWINTHQTGYGSRMFANCRKLRKLDLRGSNYGQLNSGNSAWNGGTTDIFLNCGVDNETPTIVYVSDATCRGNLITLGNKFGLGWSTENVILVEDPELEVDMS